MSTNRHFLRVWQRFAHLLGRPSTGRGQARHTPKRLLRVEALEERQLLSISTLAQTWKTLSGTLSGTYTGNNYATQSQAGTLYNDNFTGSYQDTVSLVYENQNQTSSGTSVSSGGTTTTNNGSGSNSANTQYWPAGTYGAYTFTFNGAGTISEDDGTFARSAGTTDVVTRTPSASTGGGCPYDIATSGTDTVSGSNIAVSGSWNNSMPISGGQGAVYYSTGNYSGTIVQSGTFDMAVTSASWNANGTLDFTVQSTGPCVPVTVANRNTPIATVSLYWADANGNHLGSAMPAGDTAGLYWNEASATFQETGILESNVPAGASQLLVVINGSNSIPGFSEANMANNTLSLAAPTNPSSSAGIDGSFETPALSAKGFQYSPNGTAWQFANGSGVASNGSAFTGSNPSAPAGTQVAFIQVTGSMSQSLYLDAGSYSLSFMAAQRAGDAEYQQLQVLVDGLQVGLITPASTSYSAYQTADFTVSTTGAHTVTFVGVNPLGGDNTAFVDSLSIQQQGITDGSFETPALAAGAVQATPTGTSWQFTANTGVSSNGSTLTSANPSAPDGTQVAYLELTGGISQSLYLDAGAYTLSFLAAQQAGQTHNQEIEVLLDGVQVGLDTPAGTQYTSYQTANFTVATAGIHTVQLLGLNPQGGSNTAFIDSVMLQWQGISDGNFELPALTTGGFQYSPTDTSWQFGTGGGIAGNGSAFTAANPNAPQGTQVAFLQVTGSMSQSLYLGAGVYSVSFLAAERVGDVHDQQVEITLDGVSVGVCTLAGIQYTPYETANFTVKVGGTHTIGFVGLNPQGGDNTAFLDEVAVQRLELGDGNFAAPSLAAGAFQYTPGGTTWQFTAGAGVSGNGSAFTAGNPNAPQGTQVAFLQVTGSMSQSIYLAAGSYSLSFLSAERAGQAQYQQIEVEVDGVEVGLYNPPSTQYSFYQTSNFSVSMAGIHTVSLVALNPAGGDNTAFIDDVSLQCQALDDTNFQTPIVAAGNFQYAPAGIPWQFTAGAGVSGNASAFTSGNPNAPVGTQVAFLQVTGGVSQSVSLNAGIYSLSFLAAQRAGQGQYQEIQVLVDGAAVATYIPPGTQYTAYQTANFSVTSAGTHTIEFVGMDPHGGDNTAFIDEVVLQQEMGIIDGSFETPPLAAGAFQYAPSSPVWSFGAGGGIASNGSAFTSGNPNAPDGTQVAFLQVTGSVTQSVSLAPGTYSLSFLAAQRAGDAASQEIEVLVDGTAVGTDSQTGTQYTSYQTPTFTISTAGAHTIELVGLNLSGGDNTAFIDSVAISSQGS